jgi:diguanylate cyclase (GGDEF)-like protein/PAS domain S-box-containing protein/putative nucleotidyltransferase with HDIG domain
MSDINSPSGRRPGWPGGGAPIQGRRPGWPGGGVPNQGRRGWRFGPTASSIFVSAGIACAAVTVLLACLQFGILPSQRNVAISERKILTEQLAVNCTLHDLQKNTSPARRLIAEVVRRNDHVVSGAIRGADGRLLVEVGDHPHQAAADHRSTETLVKVPILSGGKPWGTVEVGFVPLGTGTWLSRLFPPWIGVVAATVFAANLLYFWWLRRRTERMLSDEIPARVRATLDTLVEGVLVLDKRRQIALANRAFLKQVGKSSDELEGRPVSELPWSTAEQADDGFPWDRAMQQRGIQLGTVIEVGTGTNERRRFSVNSTSILADDGTCRGAVATFDDLTDIEKRNARLKELLRRLEQSRQEIHNQNRELKRLATSDSLTGCLNRRSFFESFESQWDSAKQSGDPLSCLMIDLDHFKAINDSHGHQAGDQVLCVVAETMRDMLRDGELLCRYGGEEFCILLPRREIDSAAAVAERIRQAICARSRPDLRLSVSIGASTTACGARSVEELIAQADQALYAAKRTGRNQVTVWDDRLNEQPPQSSLIAPVAGAIDSSIPFHAVTSLITALAHRDPRTAEHSRRVADLCVAAARGLMPERDCYVLEVAALLHDIGKLGVPDAVLLKPGPLTDREWKEMQTHESRGVDIIQSAFQCRELTEIVANHHTYFGGAPQHPELPSGTDIPFGARLLAIADAYDAIVSDRVYRSARSPREAVDELRRCAGSQFDPELVERFIATAATARQRDATAASRLSKQGALQIGLQIEKLADAVDSQDVRSLFTMAERLKSTAVEYRVADVAELSRQLAHAAELGGDPLEIVELAAALLDECRGTQHAYLAGLNREPPAVVIDRNDDRMRDARGHERPRSTETTPLERSGGVGSEIGSAPAQTE